MPRRKKTETEKDAKAPAEAVEDIELQEEQSQSIETVVNQSFFYTNDKFFEQFEYKQILKKIIKAFPKLSTTNTDSVIKKGLIELLNDENFVDDLLEFYSMSIYDLFKIFYKTYSSIFKGTYLKKVRSNLEGKSYVGKRYEKY